MLGRGRDSVLAEMQEEAQRLGANAVVGVDPDDGAVGASETMTITAAGAAVILG